MSYQDLDEQLTSLEAEYCRLVALSRLVEKERDEALAKVRELQAIVWSRLDYDYQKDKAQRATALEQLVRDYEDFLDCHFICNSERVEHSLHIIKQRATALLDH